MADTLGLYRSTATGILARYIREGRVRESRIISAAPLSPFLLVDISTRQSVDLNVPIESPHDEKTEVAVDPQSSRGINKFHLEGDFHLESDLGH